MLWTLKKIECTHDELIKEMLVSRAWVHLFSVHTDCQIFSQYL